MGKIVDINPDVRVTKDVLVEFKQHVNALEASSTLGIVSFVFDGDCQVTSVILAKDLHCVSVAETMLQSVRQSMVTDLYYQEDDE